MQQEQSFTAFYNELKNACNDLDVCITHNNQLMYCPLLVRDKIRHVRTVLVSYQPHNLSDPQDSQMTNSQLTNSQITRIFLTSFSHPLIIALVLMTPTTLAWVDEYMNIPENHAIANQKQKLLNFLYTIPYWKGESNTLFAYQKQLIDTALKMVVKHYSLHIGRWSQTAPSNKQTAYYRLLYEAIYTGNQKLVLWLLKRCTIVLDTAFHYVDREISLDDATYNPLFLALHRHIDNTLAHALILKNAHINFPSYLTGNSPLHCAVHLHRLDLIEFLLHQGAAINIVNKAGATPRALAKKLPTYMMNRQKIITVLTPESVVKDF